MKAIVIADDHYNGLGLIRSLGKMKIKIFLVLLSGNQSTMIEKSKYITRIIRSEYTEDDIVDSVKSCMDECNEYYLYPLTDYAAIICDKYRLEFGRNVHVPHANGKVEYYENKKVFSDLAESYGLNVPVNRIIERGEQNPEWNIYPAIIKPLKSIEGHKWDITIVENNEELNKTLNSFWGNGYDRVLIEQYISGSDDYMIEIMGISNGDCVSFARIIKKNREYPIKNGSTAYAELVDQHPDISFEKIESLIKGVKFDGIFDAEFKYSNGKSYFIEFNFRNGAPSYISTLDGFNLPYNWYLLHTDKGSLQKKSFGISTFMVENRDILNMAKGDVPMLTWILDFFKARKVFFTIRDLRPCIKYYKELLLSRH